MAYSTPLRALHLNSVPKFPDFALLDVVHKNEFEEYTKFYPPYSDFNFTSLWAYNTEEDVKISQLNGNMVMKFRDYITNDQFYTFLGHQNVEQTVQELLQKSKEENIEPVLKLIPEINLAYAPELINTFIVTEDPDNNDYILSSLEVGELKSRKFTDKRNLVNRFLRDHPDVTIVQLDLDDPVIQDQILDIFNRWETKKGKRKQDTEHEYKAIQRLFHPAIASHLIAFGIFRNGDLIGFLIIEEIHDNYAIFHFMKADPDHKGTYEFLNHWAAKHVFSHGLLHINYEQDLGIEGLRRAKTFWNPTHFLKKYTIAEK
jgi:hypothetical protein